MMSIRNPTIRYARLLPLLGAGLALLAPFAAARAIVISLDPVAQTVTLGAPVTVNLVAGDLGAGTGPSIGAWDVDIAFDPTVLAFTGATFGAGLDVLGFGTINGVFDVPGLVDLFEVSFDLPEDLDMFQPSVFTLATLTFATQVDGFSALALTIDELGDALGNRLMFDSVFGATVTVERPAVQVPEPQSLGLLAVGLLMLATLRRRRRRAG